MTEDEWQRLYELYDKRHSKPEDSPSFRVEY